MQGALGLRLALAFLVVALAATSLCEGFLWITRGQPCG